MMRETGSKLGTARPGDPRPAVEGARQALAETYQAESGRVFATLVRLLGDFDLAEEALHDAFAAAAEQWPREGIPANPRSWLVSAGRFKAIDAIRRRARFDQSLEELARRQQESLSSAASREVGDIEDDRLRLIFVCCHPVLPPSTQVALTLREVCGLKTEEIAAAFLTSPATIAQRIVRGKAKIREERIEYQVPSTTELPERLDSLLAVIYLVYNEGYSASSGSFLTRPDLSGEAIRLGRLLASLLPDQEVFGLLALMLLQESRREARASAAGDIILLADQVRSKWNAEQIAEGLAALERAMATRAPGPYTLQAAIAATHASAPSAEATDWNRIVAHYDALFQIVPSPVVALNRAVAVAFRDGAQAGLALIEELLATPELARYHLAHAARADLCRRLGRAAEARASYRAALDLVQQEPERRFLERRLRELA